MAKLSTTTVYGDINIQGNARVQGHLVLHNGNFTPENYPGFVGYTGSRGDTGPASTTMGYTGSQGNTGPASTTMGYTGSQGNTGPASTTIGYTGSRGYTGSTASLSQSLTINSTASGYIGSTGFTYNGTVARTIDRKTFLASKVTDNGTYKSRTNFVFLNGALTISTHTD